MLLWVRTRDQPTKGLGRAGARLVRGGRKVHAALEHAAVPPAELLAVGLLGVLEARHRALREEEAKHACRKSRARF